MKEIYVPRTLGNEILRSAKEFPVVVVTGPRQTGKSTLLRKLFPSHEYSTMDDPFKRNQALKDPLLFLETLGERAIIDEIQYVPSILPYIKMAVDRSRRPNGRYLLTGSQYFPLMTGISESLAGRAGLHELLGFSVEELEGRLKMETPPQCFSALFRGFYPEAAVHGVNRADFFRSYLQTYLERDIRQIRSVHDLRRFQDFLELLAARAGNLLNLNEIAKESGISHTSAQKWLSLLETTRIVYLLRPYFRNISKRVVKSPKLYFTDTGLLAFLLRYPDSRTLMAGPAAGSIFENFVVIEVLKNKLNRNRLFELYFYRDSNQNEIDLVLDYGRSVKRFEIKTAKTLRDEYFSTLIRTADVFKQSESFLVSLNPDRTTFQNVQAIHWKVISAVL